MYILILICLPGEVGLTKVEVNSRITIYYLLNIGVYRRLIDYPTWRTV